MRLKIFLKELKHHIPFTIIATLAAILVAIIIQYYFKYHINEYIFDSLHILHIVVSSIVTTGIYYKYKKNISVSLIVGVVGAIAIGSLSDIIFPWLGGTIYGLHMHFHLPLVEIPIIVIGVALAGGVIGIITNFTKIPHFIHVFLSVFASLFYLLTFSASFELIYFVGTFLIVFVSVILPCCLSDIVFPFLFIRNEKDE